MNMHEQIKEYFAIQPEPKRTDMQELHRIIVELMPECKLWFLDGKDEKGQTVSNPNVGYGFQTIKYADGKTREFYQIGISANTTGISVYILGIKDKKYLAQTYPNRCPTPHAPRRRRPAKAPRSPSASRWSRRYRCEALPSPEAVDWIIVMGGPMNVYEYRRHPWLCEEKKFLTAALEANKTSWLPISLRVGAGTDLYFPGVPRELTVFHWHGDTFDLPAEADWLASSEGCAHQAFAVSSLLK